MSNLIELKVPDIGSPTHVGVIEVFIKPGDMISQDTSLITLETDKAMMDVPATTAGLVKEVKVVVGSRVSEGDVIAIVEPGSMVGNATASTSMEISGAPPSSRHLGFSPQLNPKASSELGSADIECDVMVLGGGPGGYSAAFRAADLGLKVVIVERYDVLGGVCLNVGCIPSKALLKNTAAIDAFPHLAENGIAFGKPEVSLEMLRGHAEKVIAKLACGLTSLAAARKVGIVHGNGRFINSYHIEVATTIGQSLKESGDKKIIHFKKAIIAAGSRILKPPFIPDDPRVMDSTGALKLRSVGVGKRMLIIGGGIIGLEMGTVYSRLGARLDVVEMMGGLMQGADRDLVRVWQHWNAHRFDRVMLNTKIVAVEPRDSGVWVTFEGDASPKEPECYDLVLYATGREPNGRLLGAENAGIAVSDRGFIVVDKQQRTNVPHIFAIGDIVGQPMLAHKSVHEGHVAAENCAGRESYFDARVIPSVAYTDPEIAWVGITEEEAKKRGLEITIGVFPWRASGRAIANDRDEGFTKLIFDAGSHQIIGGCIVGPHADDMIGEVSLAIEMGCDAVDIGKTIHPHPTMGESIGMAAEVAHGTCTDLPPQ